MKKNDSSRHHTQLAATRLIFVNRFYAPDTSATSQILTDVAEYLAQQGHSVQVYTSGMSYDGRQRYRPIETIKSVRIHRIWSTKFGRNSTLGRAIDYFSFYASISLHLFVGLRKDDVLIAKTDPPMLSVPLGLVARLRKANMVNWLQDIFPEVAQNLGLGSKDGPLIKALKFARNRSLKRAKLNIAIGNQMADKIHDIGVDPKKVTIIENFVDDTAIVESQRHSPCLRSDWGFSDTDFIVGYSGNLGRAHDLDTVLNAASELRDLRDLKFLFIGGGFLHERLNKEINQRDLQNVVLKPYQPRERLPESLALPNLHWASLTPSLEGYIVPSKIYGVASIGRPLLMIGDPSGEVGKILQQFKFGACISPGDHKQVKAFIIKLRQEYETTALMGRRARHFIDCRASKGFALRNWDENLSALIRNY